MFKCRSLNFSYANKQILKDINLDFKAGKFVAILGRNGAGKTTLLRCLTGIQKPNSGSVILEDIDVLKAGRKKVARNISLVSQEHGEMFPFSVLDMVVMGRTPFMGALESPKEVHYEMGRKILTELHISHLEQRKFNSLSGGEKQLVMLARAFIQSRKMIFLDEPTNHLDYKNRYNMLFLLKKMCRKYNSCVVTCLHDPNYALHFADEVVLLHKGRVLDHGETSQVMTDTAISRLYEFPVKRKEHDGANFFEPSAMSSKSSGNTILIVGKSGSGKTTVLQDIVEKLQDQVKIGGIVCPGTIKNNIRHSSSIVNIATGQTVKFGERGSSGKFEILDEGLTLAQKSLESSVNQDKDVVVVDEVGPFELVGKGYAPWLSPLLAIEQVTHIWAVRPTILEDVQAAFMLRDPHIVDLQKIDTNQAVDKVVSFIKERVCND